MKQVDKVFLIIAIIVTLALILYHQQQPETIVLDYHHKVSAEETEALYIEAQIFIPQQQ